MQTRTLVVATAVALFVILTIWAAAESPVFDRVLGELRTDGVW